MNRRHFLRAALATAALPVLELVPVPVAARTSPVWQAEPQVALTIFERALSDEEMAALCRGHGLITATDQWGIPQHTWIIPRERIVVDWRIVVGDGILRAVGRAEVRVNGSVEFTKTDPGITVIEGLMCSCPTKFEGHVFRRLRTPIRLLLADTLSVDHLNFLV
jgi:hypothetical protein